MDHVECIIAGGGVVGLAIARALALAGREVIVLEAEGTFGSQTSSRNSEVIHAGIYYAAGSLKAQFCVAGKKALYAYCEERNIAHLKTGKLIVASHEAEVEKLASIKAHAQANGVDDITDLSAEQAIELEPALHCVGALFSPSTGIIDSHGLMLSMLGEIEESGGFIAYRSKVVAVRPEAGRLTVTVDNEGAETLLTCTHFINAAGHGAWDIAAATVGLAEKHLPQRHLSKGNYYALSGHASPFEHLVYPVPADGSLGIHFTRDIAGQARFGPDVNWFEGTEFDYSVMQGREQVFESAIRTYWPGLPDNALVPSYCGVRPKLNGPGTPPADFIIQSPGDTGINGLIQLFGFESPGLTSCLAIGDAVNRMVSKS